MQVLRAPFHAIAAERLSPAARALRRVDSTLILAVLLSACLYGALFGVLVYENGSGVPIVSEEQEIPVEIVEEPPPPPPAAPTPSPEPQAMAQPEEEKPAIDSPRAGNNDKRDDEHAADPAKPSAAPPPPSDSPPVPAPSPLAAAPQTPELPTAPDGDAPVFAKADPQTPAEVPVPPKPAPARNALDFASVPDLDFGGAAKYAAVSGGNARATYLTILHGLIVPRMRVPPSAHTFGRRLHGAIAFAVDASGRLTERWVAQSSGSNELDAAAMAAVGAASSQFPPPPRGSPRGVRFEYTTD